MLQLKFLDPAVESFLGFLDDWLGFKPTRRESSSFIRTGSDLDSGVEDQAIIIRATVIFSSSGQAASCRNSSTNQNPTNNTRVQNRNENKNNQANQANQANQDNIASSPNRGPKPT